MDASPANQSVIKYLTIIEIIVGNKINYKDNPQQCLERMIFEWRDKYGVRSIKINSKRTVIPAASANSVNFMIEPKIFRKWPARISYIRK
ncbi:MAG: hypothetical protein ACJAZP_003449 [Psychromonas sp.]